MITIKVVLYLTNIKFATFLFLLLDPLRHKCEISNFCKDAALARVGHTAHHLQSESKSEWILLVGGANLSSCCKNSLLYNIKKGQVYPLDSSAFERYEHSSAIWAKEVNW